MRISSEMKNKFSAFEHSIFHLTGDSHSILFCLIYRPPKSSTVAFFEELSTLSSTLLHYEEIVILGDFNVQLKYENELLNFLSTFSFHQHILGPTHNKGGTLDLSITRSASAIISQTDVRSGVSDHEAVFFSISFCIESFHP